MCGVEKNGVCCNENVAGAPDSKLPFVHAPTRVATAELRRLNLRRHKLRRALLANDNTAGWVHTGNGRGGGGVGRAGAMHPAVKAALIRTGVVGSALLT